MVGELFVSGHNSLSSHFKPETAGADRELASIDLANGPYSSLIDVPSFLLIGALLIQLLLILSWRHWKNLTAVETSDSKAEQATSQC